ncbi:phosphomethylpyrimidine kinase [Candidatus Acidianus copahuensis]|uniref:Phosphomethylpyrimidine kinase n=1 Tax=Candidatus Acidianus copahuensis TaxID=1160895 RepID=A0A031LTP7_9CREN|nr:bifunctional hydroxymethylpyrimidine kinase/phosphomethylpyrimidine kinase [Candidatus Acidianus copahuensis]EZQ10879.1 phosphomethylpyrimidine kinase [Candidatus Acidianus copahuensis]
MRSRPVVITIAGSDSGGGAGLQADLKTFTSLGVFGTTVITSLTAQNTFEVTNVLEVPPDFIAAQFDTIMKDFSPLYAKTGMLASRKIIDIVKEKVIQYGIKLVLDPVMVAKSGSSLISEDIMPSLEGLLKESLISTPNKFEAEIISGFKIESPDDLMRSARKIYEKYGNVIVKGGSYFNGLDVAVIDGNTIEVRGNKVETKNVHGSGDVFSAAITAYLAKGFPLLNSIKMAKEFVENSIAFSLDLGKGHGPVDPFSNPERKIAMEEAREELEELLYILEKEKDYLPKLIDDDEKANVAIITPYNDYATLAGGIIRYLEWTKLDGPILINPKKNTVVKALEISSKRVGIKISPTQTVIKSIENGKVKISESGFNSDMVSIDGKLVLVANSTEELLSKIEMILK